MTKAMTNHLKQTNEAELLMLFRDRMIPYAGRYAKEDYSLQEAIKVQGMDIVKALQNNHGHSLADAVAMMRMVLNGLNIK